MTGPNISTDSLFSGPVAALAQLSDSGNAEVFADMYGDLVRYDHTREEWLIWDSHRFRADRDGTIDRMAKAVPRERLKYRDQRDGLGKWALHSESAAALRAMLSLARSLKPIADDGAGWNLTPGMVGAPNGVIELKTGELRDGLPGDQITFVVGADYTPGLSSERFEKFLLDVFNDAETVAYVQMLVGAALAGKGGALQLFMMLLGIGNNGKSLFLRMMRRVFGDYAYDLPASVLLAGGRNAHLHWLADLEAKRFITCMELGDSEALNTDRVKLLTGSDDVTADRKFKAGRVFQNTWLLALTTNTQPKPTENTTAYWRRARVVPTPNSFSPEDDPNLEDDLLAERAAILAWVVQGAVRFYAEGMREGDRPHSVIDATEEYREDQDKLAVMFKDGSGYLEKSKGYWVPTNVVWAVYQRWCNEPDPATGRERVPLEYRYRTESTLAKALRTQVSGLRPYVKMTDGTWKKTAGLLNVRIGQRYPVEHGYVYESRSGLLAPQDTHKASGTPSGQPHE